MVNLCIVNEDHPQCNGPRKAIKACPGRGQLSWALSGPLALSHLESGHAIPFSPQDFCSPCVFVYCIHNPVSCGPGSVSAAHHMQSRKGKIKQKRVFRRQVLERSRQQASGTDMKKNCPLPMCQGGWCLGEERRYF